MLFTNLLYHSRFDTQIFKMPITFIYTFVCSYTYRLFWYHALQLPCWKFAAPLCLIDVGKTPRLQKTIKVACETSSSYWQRRCFHTFKKLQYHVYLNHCTYVNIHIHVCHFDFMLYTHLSYRVHAFHLFIQHLMFDASHFELPLLIWFNYWKQQTQKIILAASTY